ncbi:MAG: Dot/Icm T4SS effector AnkY/LegA9 [Legionella sp.]|jgi:hypothetical protein
MKKTILIHAHCVNKTAKGDYFLAGSIAADLAGISDATDYTIALTSSEHGVAQFEALYGKATNGMIKIKGHNIALCELESIDPLKIDLVAFIEANRCKYAPAEIIKRILSPNTKFLFIGAAHQPHPTSKFMHSVLFDSIKSGQPGLYDSFDEDDTLIATAGIGPEQLGLPYLPALNELPPLVTEQTTLIPTAPYGFMYFASHDPNYDARYVSEYMQLTKQNEYVLVGDFSDSLSRINYTIKDIFEPGKTPVIHFHQSLNNTLMRTMVARSSNKLVLSTGVMGVFELFHESKLPYYEYMEHNSKFIISYLTAVKSICSSDENLVGAMPKLIIELSNLLFSKKPMLDSEFRRTKELLNMDSVSSNLIEVNSRILKNANGRLAPQLLSFIGGPRKTQDYRQCVSVCLSLRKTGESNFPSFDQALRRAASKGLLFELKVLINYLSVSELNKTDNNTTKYTALHWAVKTSHYECAKKLIEAGSDATIKDGSGLTPLDYARSKSDKALIDLLSPTKKRKASEFDEILNESLNSIASNKM